MRKIFTLGVALLFLAGTVAVAQDQPTSRTGVAKILQITREDIKIGKADQHENLVRAVRRANISHNTGVYWVAAHAVSGNTGEQLFFGGYDSFADLERGHQALGKAMQATLTSADASKDNIESHLNKRGIIARLREDISYNQDRINVGHNRAWEMRTVRLKPGTSADFVETQKTLVDMHKKAGIEEQWAVYEVKYGANTPTFLFFTPLKSISDLDDTRLEAVHKATFTSTVNKQFNSVLKESILTDESTLLAVNPEISNPEPAIVAANPTFWTVRDTDATALASSRNGKTRKPVVEPASKKETKRY